VSDFISFRRCAPIFTPYAPPSPQTFSHPIHDTRPVSVARPGGHGVVEQFQMLSRGSRALLVPPVANYGPAIYRRSSILFEGTVESH
jgi:hypothetical protein